MSESQDTKEMSLTRKKPGILIEMWELYCTLFNVNHFCYIQKICLLNIKGDLYKKYQHKTVII